MTQATADNRFGGVKICLSWNSGYNKYYTNSNIGYTNESPSFTSCHNGKGEDGFVQASKFNFDIKFTVKLTKHEGWLMNIYSENMLCRNTGYTFM